MSLGMILLKEDFTVVQIGLLPHIPSLYIFCRKKCYEKSWFSFNLNPFSCAHRLAWKRLAAGNGSLIAEFILLGLTDKPDLQLPLFCLFLGMYTLTVLGNLDLMILIGPNSHLHTPMYFFLFILSFIDFFYS